MGSSFEAVRASSPCIGNSGGAAGGGGGNNGVSAGSTAVTNRAEAPAAPTPAPGTADPSLSNSTPSASTATTTTTTTTPTTTANSTAILHTHRQNHNSSKLPAFRFADLQKESLALPLPSLLHNHNFPPSPVSPDLDQHRETQSNAPQETPQHEHEHEHKITNNSNQNNSPPPQEPEEPVSPKTSSPVRSRASTFQTQTHPAPVPVPATSSTNVKRSASLDCSTAVTTRVANSAPNTPILKSPLDSTETIVAVRPQHRRAPLSANSIGIESSRGGEITQGQRELLLPKSIQKTASDDRRSSVTRRPPVSYKPPVSSNGSGGSASIPPIRAFRSSGERRSLVLDMNTRSMRAYDVGDDYGDSNHRDRTLRALEGRRSGDASHMITPPDSAGERPDGDDSGDLFLKIAREDPSRRVADRNGAYGETQSAITRVARNTRRPLSVAYSSYHQTSPPQVSRRLSEQETSRSKGSNDDQRGEKIARTLTYRGPSKDRPSDETRFKGTGTPLRASPLTPRSLTFQDMSSDQGPAYNRRRQPSIDEGTPVPSRMSSLKQSTVNYSHPRTYGSSPLVPKPTESQRQDTQPSDGNHGVEGTDSTTSTAAPSTVWDELDDLKSRIHRLELTGKLPPTSGAAISRASEERPPTAHTNATTLSASPKRGSGSAAQSSDVANGQKEGHPLLSSALTKSKGFLRAEIFEALETAANDALALSSMMGTAGQPGPIASGASTIGNGTITDRQLRRKADSICRSLTELCLALSESVAQSKLQRVATPASEKSPPGSPTITKFSDMTTQRRPGSPTITKFSDMTVRKQPSSPTITKASDMTIRKQPSSPTITKFSDMTTQRRPSVPNHNLALTTSPRALTRLEEKRNNMFISSALPSPRYSSTTPASPADGMAAGRKSSFLQSRSRRAGSEEPEEPRKSSLLRTRRAVTEEPEDRSERKPLLMRSRRGTESDNEDGVRFRAPSRAITEAHGVRSGNHEYSSQLPAPPVKEPEVLASSALPRRRLGSSALNTRLAQPTTTGIATPSRRYFDRSIQERDTYSVAEKPTEDRPQRQFSLARTGSQIKRPTRESMIATSSTTNGGYR